jgi:two-component system cell cycle sensor histidine kinase/response regulator CckA
MATTPLGSDNYPKPLVSSARGGSGFWRVAALGLVLVGAAAVFALFGEAIPAEVVMAFVGLLAVAGVFFLFGLAAGLLR